MTRSLFSSIFLFLLVACAGSPEGISPPTSGSTPPPAVVVPANALPPEELLNLASPRINRGQFKGDYNPSNHPLRLSIALRYPTCLFMKDGFSHRPRNVRNINADGKDDVKKPLVAIGFHSENFTCGRDKTDEGVPYVYVAIALRLMPNWWLFVANDRKDNRGNWVHCGLSRDTLNPMVYPYSWCKPV